jgi:hypothetical protein
MNKITFLILFLTGLAIQAQTGINTINPQGTLHVDGAKDNATTGVPTLTQQQNDFIVTTNGKVGVGTTTVDTSAKMEIKTTTKGMLVPRMTTLQRDAISSPEEGLLIYNTTENVLTIWNGTKWANL